MIAIIGAMEEEIALIVASLSDVSTRELGGRRFHLGTFHGVKTIAVFSRWGKVAAAATVTQLLASFPVTRVIFSGVAGGIAGDLAIGDVVVASGLIQHDLDASPIFPRYQIPLLGKSILSADARLSDELFDAAKDFLSQDLHSAVAAKELDFFAIRTPKVTTGLVASGDRFFSSTADVRELHARLPAVSCVEMEGAAVAQVCTEYGVPFGVVRTISDNADENSPHDFQRFLREIARHYSAGILARFLQGFELP